MQDRENKTTRSHQIKYAPRKKQTIMNADVNPENETSITASRACYVVRNVDIVHFASTRWIEVVDANAVLALTKLYCHNFHFQKANMGTHRHASVSFAKPTVQRIFYHKVP